jgi:hypothetical protein
MATAFGRNVKATAGYALDTVNNSFYGAVAGGLNVLGAIQNTAASGNISWSSGGSDFGRLATSLESNYSAAEKSGWYANNELSRAVQSTASMLLPLFVGELPPGGGFTAAAEGVERVGGWQSLPGGVRIQQVGNYWIKEVNPEASSLAQWWGRSSLEAQASALDKLGNMAPSNLFKNGKLITRDAGAYTPGNFLDTWLEGSRRLGTPFNDIRPRNIGANSMIFDPAKHPIQQGLEAGAVGLGVGVGSLYLYDKLK